MLLFIFSSAEIYHTCTLKYLNSLETKGLPLYSELVQCLEILGYANFYTDKNFNQKQDIKKQRSFESIIECSHNPNILKSLFQ